MQKYISSSFKNKIEAGTKVKDITPHWTSVIMAKTNESVATVFRRLIDNGILAMPLYDDATSRYIAFVDVFDVLAYIVEVIGVPIDTNEEWLMRNDFVSTPCTVLPNRSMRNPWSVIHEEASVQTAINAMSETGLARLAVTDSQGNLVSMLTQTRLVRYLSNRISEMGPISKFPLRQFGLGKSPVVSIKDTEPAINAFLKIYQFNIGGVAVLDTDGRVIGNISITDLKDMGYSLDMFRKMFIPALEFINRKIEGADIPKVVWVTKDSEIQEVFHLFRTHWIHRVYLVDKNTKRPIDVVSASDLINVFNSDNPPTVILDEENIDISRGGVSVMSYSETKQSESGSTITTTNMSFASSQ